MPLPKRKELKTRAGLIREVSCLISEHFYSIKTPNGEWHFVLSWVAAKDADISDMDFFGGTDGLRLDHLQKFHEFILQFNRRIKEAAKFSDQLAKKAGIEKGEYFEDILEAAEKIRTDQ